MSEKQLFEERLASKLKEWQAKIDEIKANASKVASQHEIEFYRQVDLLDAKHELARKKLKESKKASGAAWDELKASIDGIWNEIENAIDSAIAKIS
ncbi:coiled coil domain-containing protein [candidate division KSB1 bacterium]|nr:coiled coil domain-containing protein [candidate division KSB1 bacterium]NIR70333.1 coiled coil domain-containing protein [candidate division KSB1 bacterium]NIS27637.1 coiled coil domain-containing protein [candidate division KSB1 bacterium]NIT74477.1 coiled coil domain-containing protein [candidate division KSB1 bacterium]NIU29002.1 coiled coil domain-containing protein [candidate division KSB1 bacterium]